MKKFARAISLLLVCFMLASLLVACNKPDDKDDGNKPPEDIEYADNLPQLDFKDEIVTVLYWEDNYYDEFGVTQASDDMVQNAVYYKNVTVEDRLNIKFEYAPTPGNTQNTAAFVQTLKSDISSGLYDYDIIGCYSLTTASCATSGLLADLNKLDYVDFDQPYWPERLTEEATILRKLYFASGDISTSYIYEMYLMFYNLGMIDDYSGLEDPISLAVDGKWTWDKFYELASVVGGGGDTNSDGVIGDGDLFGFIGEHGSICPVFFSADLKMFSHNNMGSISVDEQCFGSKADDFISEFNSFIHSSGEAFMRTGGVKPDLFADGYTLFYISRASDAKTRYAAKDGLEYSILPMPKYDENQENYVSTQANGYSLYGISSGCPIMEVADATFECMASESYRQVTPVLFETVMKYRYAPTAEASQVYDIVRETMNFDLSRIFHKALESKPQYYFKDCIRDNSNWSANATSTKKLLNKMIQDVILTPLS